MTSDKDDDMTNVLVFPGPADYAANVGAAANIIAKNADAERCKVLLDALRDTIGNTHSVTDITYCLASLIAVCGRLFPPPLPDWPPVAVSSLCDVIKLLALSADREYEETEGAP